MSTWITNKLTSFSQFLNLTLKRLQQLAIEKKKMVDETKINFPQDVITEEQKRQYFNRINYKPNTSQNR